VLQHAHLELDARLGKDVVVVHGVQQQLGAPEAVRLDGLALRARQVGEPHRAHLAARLDLLGEEDDKEGRHQVVDALHVAARRVPDGPDEQHALEHLCSLVFEHFPV